MESDSLEKFVLNYEGTFPYETSYGPLPDTKGLLFSISLMENAAKQYLEDMASDIGGVPLKFLQILSFTAAYSLNFDYFVNYGKIGIVTIYPAKLGDESPKLYKFYLGVKDELLKERKPEEIGLDLGIKIAKILERYSTTRLLAEDYSRFRRKFRDVMTGTYCDVNVEKRRT